MGSLLPLSDYPNNLLFIISWHSRVLFAEICRLSLLKLSRRSSKFVFNTLHIVLAGSIKLVKKLFTHGDPVFTTSYIFFVTARKILLFKYGRCLTVKLHLLGVPSPPRFLFDIYVLGRLENLDYCLY